jgi:hypothetical protein
LPVTSADLTAGFRGSIYLEGSEIAGCSSWKLTRQTTITDEGVLGQKVTIPVEQSLTYELALTELVINSQWSQRVLQADAQAIQLRFLFIGQTQRNDGAVERVKMDGACISADALISGIERGSSRSRDLTFRLDTVPAFDATI